MVASELKTNLVTPDDIPIDEVIHYAYLHLGSNGVIKPAQTHACSECSHAQRFVVGQEPINQGNYAPVNMVVVDGIVMGPTVSFFKKK